MSNTIVILVFQLLFVLSSFSQQSQQLVSNQQTEPDNKAENMATLIKVWGFLKYYHPEVARGKLDWDTEFLKKVRQICTLRSKEEINTLYLQWLEELGRVRTCRKCDNEVPDSLKKNFDLSWISDSATFTTEVRDRLLFISKNRNQKKNHYVTQTFFVGNPVFRNEKPYADSVYPSPDMRLLALARYWNIINYYFPYKYLIGEDWQQVLSDMIPIVRDASDTTAYHLAMLAFTVKINDGHAGLITRHTNNYFGMKWAPFAFRIIDKKAIATGFYNDSLAALNDIRKGDVFLEVNGKTIQSILEKNAPYIGASNDAARLQNYRHAIFNGSTDSVSVTFERNGQIITKQIGRYHFRDFHYDWKKEQDSVAFRLLDDNIGYINMGVLQRKQVKRMMKELQQTRGLVIDVRNYPQGTMYLLAKYLLPEKKPFAKFTSPDLGHPGVVTQTRPYYCGGKNRHNYKGRVVILFDASSISHAEFTIMALETVPGSIKIGSPTAGADGNISQIVLPGGMVTYISGIGVYYPDGRETQRMGITPDVVVEPTIEGLKAGRDEVLEKAIGVLNN